MGEVIRFVPKSERERARLIRQARAIYDSIFPSAGQREAETRYRYSIGLAPPMQRAVPATHSLVLGERE
jgi:hypothetical protein